MAKKTQARRKPGVLSNSEKMKIQLKFLEGDKVEDIAESLNRKPELIEKEIAKADKIKKNIESIAKRQQKRHVADKEARRKAEELNTLPNTHEMMARGTANKPVKKGEKNEAGSVAMTKEASERADDFRDNMTPAQMQRLKGNIHMINENLEDRK